MSQQYPTNFQDYVQYELNVLLRALNQPTLSTLDLPLPVLSIIDLNKINTFLLSARDNINSTFANKLAQATGSINTNIDNAESNISTKISFLGSSISNAITNLKNDIKYSVNFALDDVLDTVVSVGNNLSNKIAQQTIELKTAVIQSENRITQSITGQLSLTAKEIDEQTIIQDKRLQQISESIFNSNKQLTIGLQTILSDLLDNRSDDEIYSLSERIVDYFNSQNEDTLRNVLNEVIRSNFGAFVDTGTLNNILSIFSNSTDLIGKLIGGLNPVSAITGLFTGVTGQIAFGVIAYIITNNIIAPFAQHIANAAMSVAQSSIPTVEQLIRLQKLKEIDTPKYLEMMRYLGFNLDNALNMLKLGKNYLNESEIREGYIREEITLDETIKHAMNIGIDPNDLPLKQRLWRQLPHISDIIRMQVRDAFTPELVEEFELDRDFNPIVEEWAMKAGLMGVFDSSGTTWAKMFWRAHWNLPSPTQAFEMYQRGVIKTEAELDQLLRAIDIAPKWRDRLKQIAYNPLGRIDIRRFHALGVIKDEDLPRYYREQGYSPENAETSAQWTILYNAKSSEDTANIKNLNYTQILRYFRLGRIIREDAIVRLTELGFNLDTATLIIDSEEAIAAEQKIPEKIRNNYRRIEDMANSAFINGSYSINKIKDILTSIGFDNAEINDEIKYLEIERGIELRQIQIDIAKQYYLNKTVSEAEIRSLLSSYDFSGDEIEYLFRLWRLLELNNQKMPSVNDFQTWVKKGIINANDFRKWVSTLGYDNVFIELYLRETQ